jgi:hypothetical protein
VAVGAITEIKAGGGVLLGTPHAPVMAARPTRGATFLRMDMNAAVFVIGSGEYTFHPTF